MEGRAGVQKVEPADCVLRVSNLTKRFGDLTAVDRLSIEVRRGEILGFLGPNGAGKTTSLKMMCGLLRPDAGTVEINGKPLEAGRSRGLKEIGVAPQNLVIWETLTCLEQLELAARLYDRPRGVARQRAQHLLETFGLSDKARRLGKTLSGGMQRRLNIALGLVHEPEVLFLDEPQAGLDPQSRVLVRDHVQSLRGTMTAIITTHDMEEAEKLCDRVCIVDHDTLDGRGTAGTESAALLAAWRQATHPDGKPVFAVVEQSALGAAQAQVKSRDADLLVEIPAGFTAAVTTAGGQGALPARLTNHADERNLRSTMAMAMSDYVAFTQVATRTGVHLPLDVTVASLGSGRPVSDFDLYVPALLTLAIIMILFTAATSLIKEVDKGTMTRLMLSRLKTPEMLTAVSANQVLLGVVALALAYLAALSCGYRSDGSLVALLVVGAAATLGVVAIAVLCSAFLKSMFELLTVGTFPFFILMFFSECMFPLPKIPVVALGSHTLYANDILPTTLCVRAFNKILSFGAGLGDVSFELGAILVLTAGYFAVGTWLFSRRHQRV